MFIQRLWMGKLSPARAVQDTSVLLWHAPCGPCRSELPVVAYIILMPRIHITVLLLLVAFALQTACAAGADAKSDSIKVWTVDQQNAYIRFKVCANDRLITISSGPARLVARAPKWDVHAFNKKDRSQFNISLRRFISLYPPLRRFELARRLGSKCSIAGVSGVRIVSRAQSASYSDAGSGLLFRESLKTRIVQKQVYVFAADEHGLTPEAKEIWRCFLELRTANAIPLEVYDEFVDGDRTYLLKTLSQRWDKLDLSLCDSPRNYKQVDSILSLFFSGHVNDMADLMGK